LRGGDRQLAPVTLQARLGCASHSLDGIVHHLFCKTPLLALLAA
jgi:hypothetical protein